jgi:hypothetical protein
VFPPARYCNTNVALTLQTDNLHTITFTALLEEKTAKTSAEAQMSANPLMKLQLKYEKQNARRVKYSGM